MPKRSFTLEDVDNLPTWFTKATPQKLFTSDQVAVLFDFPNRDALNVTMHKGCFLKATKKLSVHGMGNNKQRLFWSKKDLMNYILTLIV